MTKATDSSFKSKQKYLDEFDNPYVDIVLVCKICRKEQTSRNASVWKSHYLTHVPDSDKPLKCSICQAGFVQNTAFKKHMQRHEKEQQTLPKIKEDYF